MTPETPAGVGGTGGGCALTTGYFRSSFLKLTHYPSLTKEQNRNNVLRMFLIEGSGTMLKTFVEEAAALASLVLFVGMIAVWAQLIPQL
jgi:hypothetical protein